MADYTTENATVTIPYDDFQIIKSKADKLENASLFLMDIGTTMNKHREGSTGDLWDKLQLVINNHKDK